MNIKGLKIGETLEIGNLILRTGVYLISSPTAGGKTTTMIKLLSYIEERTSLNVEMHYVGEPESETSMKFEDLKSVATKKGKVYLIDSMTMAMLEVASDSSGQVIFKGGLLPAYVVTLLDLNIHCINKGVCIILTLNETLFPVVDLSGATQGRIDILGVDSIRVKDRSNREGYTFNYDQASLLKAKKYIEKTFGSVARSGYGMLVHKALA